MLDFNLILNITIKILVSILSFNNDGISGVINRPILKIITEILLYSNVIVPNIILIFL